MKAKAKAEQNIQSDAGILHRQIRSVQAEGSFGDKKQNRWFRRFQYRGKDKVYPEQLLDVMGVNFMKDHRFKHGKIRHLKLYLLKKLLNFKKLSGEPEAVFVVSKCRENTSRKKYSRVTSMS